jgi:hypothetical protein
MQFSLKIGHHRMTFDTKGRLRLWDADFKLIDHAHFQAGAEEFRLWQVSLLSVGSRTMKVLPNRGRTFYLALEISGKFQPVQLIFMYSLIRQELNLIYGPGDLHVD